MTVRDVLGATGRRWYAFLVVLVAFAALAVVLERDGGAFYTNSTITFTLPERPTLLPDSGTNDLSVIAFASAVAVSVNEGKPVATYSSAQAPYYGAGVRQGVSVSLRNDGSQWISSYPNATIDAQIVGPTYEWVAERQEAILTDIMSVTRGQQAANATAETDQITAVIAPLSTEIVHVTASRSTQMLAFSAIALAGIATATTVSVVIDRLVRRSRRRTRPRVVTRPRERQLAQTGGLSA